jgi:hypothetical protein
MRCPRISPLTGRISQTACRRRDLEAAIASRDAEHRSPRVRVLPGRGIPPALPRKARPPRPRSHHPVNGPPGRPRAAPVSHVPALPQPSRSAEGLSPVPPAPGRTGRKPVGRAAWRQSPHRGRLTPPCVAGRARVRHCRGCRRRGHHPPGRGRSCEHPPARASDDGGAGEPALTGPAEPDLVPADLHQRHRRRRAADTAGGLVWHGRHLAEPRAWEPLMAPIGQRRIIHWWPGASFILLSCHCPRRSISQPGVVLAGQGPGAGCRGAQAERYGWPWRRGNGRSGWRRGQGWRAGTAMGG